MVIFMAKVLSVSFAKPPMDKGSWNKRVRYQGGPSVSQGGPKVNRIRVLETLVKHYSWNEFIL